MDPASDAPADRVHPPGDAATFGFDMQPHLRLVLALHNHQPVGNFDGVFAASFDESYRPFLDVLDDYPDLPIVLHTSGSLLEWLSEHRSEYLDRVRTLVERGQIEVLGGPYYEPILACIPRRDRIGQIRAYSQYLEQIWGQPIRGMWVPERVWEQSFAGDVTAAGIEYTIVDDFHFKGAGLKEEQLYGYYLTEDERRLLKVFPGSETLRYTIPFRDPHETIDYLRSIAESHRNPVVVFGDDGEKFGTWPGTQVHVYQNGWLRRFFDALLAEREWLTVCTLADAVGSVAPLGRISLPDCSYREMTEWALPTEQRILYHDLVHRKQEEPDWPQLKQFVRGGTWRNFLTKYAESNEMYCRMHEVSARLDRLRLKPLNADQGELLEQAQAELYRGQCNCPYWHGAFGGLYLPHLRNAIYHHLIAADTLLEGLEGRSGQWVRIEAEDYNLDARQEIRLSGSSLVAYCAPARGGHLYELDIRSTRHNLLATLNRREEPYHRQVLAGESHGANGDAVSIHDLVKFKQPDLDQRIVYDHWPRKSLVDHFLQPGLTRESFQRSEGGIGDFVTGVYDATLRQSPERVEAVLSRLGRCGQHRVRVQKTVTLNRTAGNVLSIAYQLSDLPPGETINFGVEFNFAGLAAGADDRYYYGETGTRLGQLESELQLDGVNRIGLADDWLGLDASVEVSRPAAVWTFPIQTVSQSEGGFELVHQSSLVMPHWEFVADESGCWDVRIELSLDTSMAHARQLATAHAEA